MLSIYVFLHLCHPNKSGLQYVNRSNCSKTETLKIIVFNSCCHHICRSWRHISMPPIHMLHYIGLWWVVGSIQLILNGQHPEYVIARSHQLTKCADSEMCSSVVELTSRIDCTQTGNWFESSCTVLRWTQNAAYTQKQQTEVSRHRPVLTRTVMFCSWSTYATRKQKKIGEYIFEKEEHCNALNVRVIFLV